MRNILITAMAMLLLAAVAACGGGGVNGSYNCDSDGSNCEFIPAPTPQPTLTLSPLCAFPNGTAPQMIYPAPGASGVSLTLSLFVLADTSAAPYTLADWTVWFSPLNSAAALDASNQPIQRALDHFRPITPALVPTPSASALPQNSALEGATLNPVDVLNGPLSPNTTYYTYIFALPVTLNPDGCSPNGPLGSFTTASS
jgi:hypothetical protein